MEVPTLPVNRTELTPLLFIERAARVYAQRVGAIYGRRRFTYGEIGQRVRQLATALQRAGLEHGDRVAFLAVIAVPHEKWGEVPKAFVVLKDGRQVTEADIVAHCRTQLAHFKCPKTVEFGRLPKTSTGKVQKFVLREKEWSGRTTRIN
jgi:acyl-CoA synthetase (AMP-forming)/AMP-acid ligase II